MFKKLKRKIKDFQRWKARHRIFSWPAYAKWVEEVKNDKSHFVPFTDKPYQRKDGDVKIFAYYLTQFHSIPENDNAHGKGFTEWTNVASCAPQYIGHYQPKIPYDFGFYNLLMPGVMERQVEIAKTYGIYGFCFYYYWFSGKKVLEKPLEYWLTHKEIDFHYHFCWANENWSKLWDGGNSELILEQKIIEGDAKKFFNDILPYIKDDRYEKIGNKPILMIYRPSLFAADVFNDFVNEINKLACTEGFDGFYITSSNFNFTGDDAEKWKVDAITEFPPHGMYNLCKEERTINRLIPKTDFVIFNTAEFIAEKKYIYPNRIPLFKCCFPCWDNTPRKAWSRGFSFLLTDEDYKTWLREIINWTRENNNEDRQYIYINAWNEWGEGAILEPTQRYGYKYLQITKEVLEEHNNE
ncbi:MAG: glycoside hydrolase family 99-like domain-containing protein [Bacteroidia bacterium]|nr:glycoside hydrolase family 99-like domain-containing protein [Bacteroidia bacterium]